MRTRVEGEEEVKDRKMKKKGKKGRVKGKRVKMMK